MTESESSPQNAAIMTIDEVAAYLRVSVKTVYEWAQKAEIPCGKIGNGWRFRRDEVQRWVNRRLGAERKRFSLPEVDLGRVLPPGRILIMERGRKQEVLDALIECLSAASEVADRAALTEAIYQREALMSTGIGLGVAVPHCRLTSVAAPVMAAAVIRAAIPDYDSLDGQPVRLVFMIAAGADQHAEHLRILAAISRRIKAPEVRGRLCGEADGFGFRRVLTDSGDG
jgi:PTS system nitrogen regulatory IIA component